MMQPIWNIAELLVKAGVEEIVLSPGSRCAPLVVAFARHPKLNCITISDERSAAFIAMGKALATQKVVVLVCTSGSALLNYYPAIAEAYYQQIPLLVLSADRPPEWIDQGDGQTIRQSNVYSNHIKASYELPLDYEIKDVEWSIYRKVSEGVNIAVGGQKGPVHINIPFREPFYPPIDFEIEFDESVKFVREYSGDSVLSEVQKKELQTDLDKYEKILIVAGQGQSCEELNRAVQSVFAPAITENNSNSKGFKYAIHHHDLVCSPKSNLTSFEPELIISFGKPVLSKNLKMFLRSVKNVEHWHIQEYGQAMDLFQQLTKQVKVKPETFFRNFNIQASESYLNLWQRREQELKDRFVDFIEVSGYSEFKAIYNVANKINNDWCLHLANSMSVRYANFFAIDCNEVYSNRGTSGIDGSLSTAVGIALSRPEKKHLLITGDLAFFYDRNGFWNECFPDNLSVLLLNNQGGGIFNMINGPKAQKELSDFFITKQSLNAKNTAKDFGLSYTGVSNDEELKEAISGLVNSSCRLLEVFTKIDSNTSVLEGFKCLPVS